MPKSTSPFDNFSNLGSVKNNLDEYEVSTDLDKPKDILAEDDKPKSSSRIFYILSIILSAIIVIRLLNLQISHGYENQFLAEGNRLRLIHIEPTRGIITDNQGNPLVRNIPSYDLDVSPADLPKKQKDRTKLYNYIQKVTRLPYKEISKIETNGLVSLEPITIKENIDRNTALVWESKFAASPGFIIAKRPRRDYINLPSLSHILGYTGKVNEKEVGKKGYQPISRIGKSGLEASYESVLRGKTGEEKIEVDAKGRVQRTLAQIEPKSGQNIMLSLDPNLQTLSYQALQQSLVKNHSEKGVVIALDPRDGAVKALVSIPFYDNNIFARGITSKEYKSILNDNSRPMVNRAISGLYPSGSVIKPIVAAGALQEGIITQYTSLDTSAGAIKIGQWVFPDWKKHGITNVRKAIAESNDIFFYALGGGWKSIKGLGIKRLSKVLKEFNFGIPTGIDLPSEAKGLVPDDAWKRRVMKEPWYVGDTYHMAIGQGYFLCTPIQMATSTAAIANGGKLLKPHFVSKVINANGTIIKTVDKNIIKENFISAHNLKVIKEGMRLTVTAGSGDQLRSLPVSSGAKTGTAQYGDGKMSHGWFTAFAPYDKPEIVIVVIVEGGGEGYTSAEPVAKKILEYYFSKK